MLDDFCFVSGYLAAIFLISFTLTGLGFVNFGSLFAGVSNVTWHTDNFSVIDDVTTNAVPEPETYAMMLAGLGLLGFATRRKLKAVAAT